MRDCRVLILEDERLVAMGMSQLVRDLGASVLGPYASAREASDALERQIDVALLDINVGNELAYPFADELGRRGIPTIFVTGYQVDAIDRQFASAPVLTKPIETEDLLAALCGALDSDDRRAAQPIAASQ